MSSSMRLRPLLLAALVACSQAFLLAPSGLRSTALASRCSSIVAEEGEKKNFFTNLGGGARPTVGAPKKVAGKKAAGKKAAPKKAGAKKATGAPAEAKPSPFSFSFGGAKKESTPPPPPPPKPAFKMPSFGGASNAAAPSSPRS